MLPIYKYLFSHQFVCSFNVDYVVIFYGEVVGLVERLQSSSGDFNIVKFVAVSFEKIT